MSRTAEERASELLAETREELTRADAKVSVLLAGSLVVLGVLLTAFTSPDRWQPTDLACGAELTWWIATALAGGAVVALAISLYPRISNETPDVSVGYFGHAAAHADVDSLLGALEQDADNDAPRAAQQLLVISKAVRTKYRLLQAALWCFGLGAALALVAVVAG